jgi:hypothetical protein
MKLRYGGDLQIGDFIIVANSNYTSFGWFCGRGQGGTVQYYYFRVPGDRYKTFQEWEAGKLPNLNKWYREKFEKHGFSSKLFYKEYIYGGSMDLNGSRVVKIADPESIFTHPEDLEDYRKSKEALIYIKFPVK